MFESELKRLIDYNIALLEPLGDYLTMKTISSSGIQHSIISYLNAEIDNLLYADRNRILKKSAFDYSGEKISEYFSLIENEIKNKYIFNIDDVKEIIRKSTFFHFNYLLRPNLSISNLLFPNNDVIKTEEISYLMKYIYFYPYIKMIILNYFNKKTAATSDNISFNILLTDIQRHLILSDEKSLIIKELKVISSFINFGTESNLIPPAAVELYLSDKGKVDLIEKFKSSLGGSEFYLPVSDVIEELFFKTKAEKKEAEIEQSIEEQIITEVQNTSEEGLIQNTESFQRIHNLDEPEVKLNPEDLITSGESEVTGSDEEEFEFDKFINQQLILDKEEIAENTTSADSETIEQRDDNSNIVSLYDEDSDTDKNVSIENQFQTKEVLISGNSEIPDKGKSIFEYLSDKETDKIIENLFNNDSMDFINVMEKISNSPDSNEGIGILNNFCELSNMNSDKKSLSLLQEKIEEYFNNKGK